MASKGGTSITTGETVDHQCSVCKEHNKTVEADTYCVDCQDYYCKTCVGNVHGKIPALKNHKLITKEAANDRSTLPCVPTSRCERHRSKIVDMYCQDHDEVGCYTCMIVDHTKCDRIFDIPEFVETNIKVVPDFCQAIKNVESELKAFLNKFHLEQKLLLLNKQEVIDEIEATRTRFENSIRKAAENTIQEVDKEFDLLNANLNDKITVLNSEIENICKIYSEIQTYSSNTPQAFVSSKKSKECLPAANEVNDAMKVVQLGRTVAFVPHIMFATSFRNTEACLGNVKLTPFMYSFKEIGNVDTTIIRPKTNCNLYDSCISTDGSIYFTDWDTVMLIRVCSENMNVIEHIQMPPTPRGVCCISDNEIAVCLGKTIQVLSVDGKLKLTRSIDINVPGRGLSCLGEMLYVASTDCVYKYDMDGSLVESYYKDSDGNVIFSNIENLFVNPFSKYIHITDRENGVITLEQNGSVVNRAIDDIAQPYGIGGDKLGHVFVSCYSSDKIIQLDFNGKYIQTVISKGLYRSRALCFQTTMECLYVTNNGWKNIMVFKANSNC